MVVAEIMSAMKVQGPEIKTEKDGMYSSGLKRVLDASEYSDAAEAQSGQRQKLSNLSAAEVTPELQPGDTSALGDVSQDEESSDSDNGHGADVDDADDEEK